jgi:hypothetical protein
LVKFLRENRILQDRNLLDEFFKATLILKKDETPKIHGSLNFGQFVRIFEKPLLMIPMENAIKTLDGYEFNLVSQDTT